MLARPHGQLKFTLTDAWIGLETGLTYAIPYQWRYVPYRVTRRTRGANGIIEVETLSDEAVTYTAAVAGTSGTAPVDESTEFPETRLILMDMPIIGDAHDDFGFYIAMAGDQSYWPRGTVQISTRRHHLRHADRQRFRATRRWATSPARSPPERRPGSTTRWTRQACSPSCCCTDGMTFRAPPTPARCLGQLRLRREGGTRRISAVQDRDQPRSRPKDLAADEPPARPQGHRLRARHARRGEEFCLLGTDGVFRAVYSDDERVGQSPLQLRAASRFMRTSPTRRTRASPTRARASGPTARSMSPAAGTAATMRRSAGRRARASTPVASASTTSTITRSDHQRGRADADGNRGLECRLYRGRADG
jgi:hypothetical protein